MEVKYSYKKAPFEARLMKIRASLGEGGEDTVCIPVALS